MNLPRLLTIIALAGLLIGSVATCALQIEASGPCVDRACGDR